MIRWGASGFWVLGTALVLSAPLGGCGDDEGGGDDEAPGGDAGSAGGSGGEGGNDGSGGGGTGDTADGGAGNAGSTASGGTGGGAGTGTTAGTGTIPGLGDLTGLLGGATCDPEIPTTATCGGEVCPALESLLAGSVCAVPCCTEDDQCGTRRAFMDGPTDCLPPAEPDTSCPDYAGAGLGGGLGGLIPGGMMTMDGGVGMDGGMSGGTSLVGCCAPSGRCGVLSTVDNSCITSSPVLADLMPGDACGDGDFDGGMWGGT